MTEQKLNVVCLSSNEIWRIKKNVAVITVAIMIHFTAANGAVILQSSINAEAGLGTSALVATFVGILISNIFLTSIVMKWLGIKWTVCCSFLAYVPFFAFFMYPRFSTLVPAGFLMGLGGGTLLCAKSTYISVLAEAYSVLSKTPRATALLSFSGFFFMVVHMSQFWGNLISSLVLSTANNVSRSSMNETMIPIICGGNFLPTVDAAAALPGQPPDKILTLAGIYLSCMATATLITVTALDSMKRYAFCRKLVDCKLSGFALLAVTMRQLANSNQQLLLAINIFIGLQQAFFYADYTASFVSCAIGTGSMGYVMMTYGFSNVMGCLITAYLAKLCGRVPLICTAMFVHGGILVTLLAWRPHAGDFYFMVAIAIMWGLCDSIWIVQINTYYGVLFRGKEEAAFSNLGLWEGVGYVISLAISSYVRTRYKVYLLLCILILGVTGYLTVEYRERNNNNTIDMQDWTKEKRTASEDNTQVELQRLTT